MRNMCQMYDAEYSFSHKQSSNTICMTVVDVCHIHFLFICPVHVRCNQDRCPNAPVDCKYVGNLAPVPKSMSGCLETMGKAVLWTFVQCPYSRCQLLSQSQVESHRHLFHLLSFGIPEVQTKIKRSHATGRRRHRAP